MSQSLIEQELKKQDDHLELISNDISRLGKTAKAINYELGDQNKMIDEITHDVEHADTKLTTVDGQKQSMLYFDFGGVVYNFNHSFIGVVVSGVD